MSKNNQHTTLFGLDEVNNCLRPTSFFLLEKKDAVKNRLQEISKNFKAKPQKTLSSIKKDRYLKVSDIKKDPPKVGVGGNFVLSLLFRYYYAF